MDRPKPFSFHAEGGQSCAFDVEKDIVKFRQELQESSSELISGSLGSADSKAASRNIRVFARKRPLLAALGEGGDDAGDGGYDSLTCCRGTFMFVHQQAERLGLKIDRTNSQPFRFDGVFSEDNNDEEVYNACLAPMVRAMLSEAKIPRADATVWHPAEKLHLEKTSEAACIAFGQTSAGKTYTQAALQKLLIRDLFSRYSTPTFFSYTPISRYVSILLSLFPFLFFLSSFPFPLPYFVPSLRSLLGNTCQQSYTGGRGRCASPFSKTVGPKYTTSSMRGGFVVVWKGRTGKEKGGV
jgi:hypothetical protein